MELKTEYIDNYTPIRPVGNPRIKGKPRSKKKPIMILILLLWNIGLTIDSYNLHQSVDYISIPVVEESEPKQQEVITEDLSSFKLQPVPEHLLK